MLSTDASLTARAERAVQAAPDTPEVVIDLDAVRRNVERAQRTADERGVALRPHAKTHKLPQIGRLQLDAGAVGLQVAKLGEAEVFADSGLTDLLVGFPIVGSVKLRRLERLLERARVTLTVDSLDVAETLARFARAARVELPVLLEVDTGLRRVGFAPEAAIAAGRQIAALDGLDLAGVLTHEGHAYVQSEDDDELQRLAEEACSAVAAAAEGLRSEGIAADVVSVGASGTFRFTTACPGVTEVRPGTYVFNDLSQIAVGAAAPADVAALIVATVVARPEPTRAVVDAGSKVLTSDRLIVKDSPVSFGEIAGGNGTVVRLSEEHGVIETHADSLFRVGDRVALVPNHICPVVNLANEVTVVADGSVERWPVTARGRVQ